MTEAATPSDADLERARARMDDLRKRLRAAVRGRDDVIDLILIALLADGHVLLEDFPGSGKTTLAKALGESIRDDRSEAERAGIEGFRRVQFTPDLLPSDVTGTTVFDAKSGQFSFRPGPVFAHVLLADEVNRTSPKVQAALLEAMGEKQVTVDNVTRPLDELFFVIATQNPLDLVGTFPLPVAQLDRFLFKIRMDFVERDAEIDVLRSIRERRRPPQAHPPISRDDVLEARRAVDRGVHVHPALHETLVDVARRIRDDARVRQGVSTRSLVLAIPALQARAMLAGRDHVDSDDLEAVLPRVFAHRMELTGGAEPDAVVQDALLPGLEDVARLELRAG